MKFTPSKWTKWRPTHSNHVVWTSRAGRYLFFPAHRHDHPIVTIGPSKSVWYVRPTEHCVATPTVTITTTHTVHTQYSFDIPDPPPVTTTHMERKSCRSLPCRTLAEAHRTATEIVLDPIAKRPENSACQPSHISVESPIGNVYHPPPAPPGGPRK